MTYPGHVLNGQIKLDNKASLPEGTKVKVQVIEEPKGGSRPRKRTQPRRFQPIEMPGGSLADELVRDRR